MVPFHTIWQRLDWHIVDHRDIQESQNYFRLVLGCLRHLVSQHRIAYIYQSDSSDSAFALALASQRYNFWMNKLMQKNLWWSKRRENHTLSLLKIAWHWFVALRLAGN